MTPTEATKVTDAMDTKTRTEHPRYNLRSHCNRNDKHKIITHAARVQLKSPHSFISSRGKRNIKQSYKAVAAAHLAAKHEEHVAFNQMSWRSGLKNHGEKGAEAIIKECSQLHARDAFFWFTKKACRLNTDGRH